MRMQTTTGSATFSLERIMGADVRPETNVCLSWISARLFLRSRPTSSMPSPSRDISFPNLLTAASTKLRTECVSPARGQNRQARDAAGWATYMPPT